MFVKKDDRFDGYAIVLVYDGDDEWLARFIELPHISAFGDTPENALIELGKAWEAVKASYSCHDESVPDVPRQFIRAKGF